MAASLGACWLASSNVVRAQEGAVPPHWIWHPAGRDGGAFPAETRYFRKTFSVKEPSRLALEATADNEFTLYLDGKPVADGADWHELKPVEAKLAAGSHVLAAEARNTDHGPAGFILRGSILPLGQGVPIHTNSKWKTSDAAPADRSWTQVAFDDAKWVDPVDLGVLGTPPWAGLTTAAKDAAERFQVPKDLKVETVGRPAVTGSVVAFTFDPDGHPCVSIERGPIARLIDDDGDGKFDRREVISTLVENCQGLAFLGDALYAVGNGPKKETGIYRLTSSKKDGKFDEIAVVRESQHGMGEHGPHAIMRGPDGKLYFDTGNHAHLRPPIDPHSPVNVAYEGELLPHYNDSRGHAAGIMAPGGEILRSDDDGKTWKRVVSGFRNQYDFGFNRAGELFTFDSDMEWDIGLPWYRPVRVNFCPVGAELGWRNGSGKWPSYYADSLPSAVDIGRGSPTGVTFYQASRLPAQYNDSFLICDWSQGQILAIRLNRRGAGYVGKPLPFVSGQPLNCTDIEAGPDGAVYFSTGGRGTQGGLFRVSAAQPLEAKKPAGAFPLDAIEIDSPLSSFSRKKLGEIKAAHASEWEKALSEIARDIHEKHTDFQRIRALDLLSQFGPEPTDEFLAYFTQDRKPAVRGRAAALLGLRQSEAARKALTEMLLDSDVTVVRRACEGLIQQPAETIPVDRLIPLLSRPDRWLRFAARTAIEHAALKGDNLKALNRLRMPRAAVAAMLAVVRGTSINEGRQDAYLKRQAALLKNKKLDPATHVELLRLIQLTYLLGPKKADAPASATLRPILLGQFKTSEDTPVNRELARLLAYLDEPGAVAAILKHQGTVADHAAQIHDSYCLRAMKEGWDEENKRQAWAWFETASKWDGGFSFAGYLDFMIQDLLPRYGDKEKQALLAQADKYPFPTRVLVRSLDVNAADAAQLAELIGLGRRLAEKPRSGAEAELRDMVVDKLAKSKKPEALAASKEMAALKAAAATPARAVKETKYTLEQLVKEVAKSAEIRKSASARRGALVIEKVRCLDCHKYGPKGQGVGPDLTTLNSRFGPVEILESIVEPSKVISDQYKPTTVATSDGKVHNGMPIVNDAKNLVLLLSDGSKVTIPKADIEEQKDSKTSVMPEGLLNTLSLQEIADLIALFESAPKVAPAPGVGAAAAK